MIRRRSEIINFLAVLEPPYVSEIISVVYLIGARILNPFRTCYRALPKKNIS